MGDASIQLYTIAIAFGAGIGLIILAHHLNIPAIVPLLIGGVILGPEVLGVLDPSTLKEGLRLIIAGGVAIILFEGGLTLNPEGFRKAPKTIWRLLTIGVLITWFGTAFSVYFLFKLPLAMSFLAGSLIIVTGPTVITPLLSRIGLKPTLHHILHWESVLIDALGAFIAVLCFEWISIGDTNSFLPLELFIKRVFVGAGIGLVGGLIINWLLRQEWFHDRHVNIFVLAMSVFLYGVSDKIAHESGILAVTVAGFILGLRKPPRLKNIVQFKSELTDLSISILFVLLAAKLKFGDFLQLGYKGVILIAIVLFVIRPLSIFICTFGTDATIQDKLFLSWLAPRGIVAGSMAALFSLALSEKGFEHASFLEAFTFSIIGVTVVLQGLSSGFIANFLGVKAKEKQDWIIIGAHVFSRKIATFIQDVTGNNVTLLDLNADAVREAEKEGYQVLLADALAIDTIPSDIMITVGHMLALTDNRDHNHHICEKWASYLDKKQVYRWSSRSTVLESQIGGMGVPVWTELPKPSQVAYSLKNQESSIFYNTNSEVVPKPPKGSIPLVWLEDKKIHLKALNVNRIPIGRALFYRQEVNHLPFFIHPEHVVRYDSIKFDELLPNILKKALSTYPNLPYNEILSELFEREKNFPTLLKNGVAVPHAHSSLVKSPFCLIAQIPDGMDWANGAGEEKVTLVFLLLSPSDNPEKHLTMLAEIAKIASDKDLALQILKKQTTEEILEVMRQKKRIKNS
ncbi:MAG: NhaP-type Na+/H+ or K+/H+ antiporter/mannitol [bacterium]|jgi:NhaP-type Na+/H+ or K+/H+ antiporter/mannitol/fructose-specific phosphotransferase system IIA component (Ntr-type)